MYIRRRKTHRKYIAVFASLILAAFLWPATALAATYDDGTFTYAELSNGTLAITGYSGGSGAVEIPSSFDTGSGAVSVTRIEREAFLGCTGITGVTIPSSITQIGIGAFAGCSGLTAVTIPGSVTKIEGQAFTRSGLTSVKILNGTRTIGDWAFAECGSLRSVTLPSSLTTIEDSAFLYCTSLTSITIPSSVNDILPGTFHGCTALQTVIFRSRTVTIAYGEEEDAFYGAPLSDGIYGYKGSTAEAYAIKKGSNFHALYTVTFDPAGGSSLGNQVIAENRKITQPADPTLSGSHFLGWYRDEAGGDAWNFAADTVTGDMTLYAKWGPKVTGITLSQTTALMTVGNTLKLAATVLPANAAFPQVTWKSSDENIASVNGAGLVTAKSAGKITLTAAADGVSAVCSITVSEPSPTATPIPTATTAPTPAAPAAPAATTAPAASATLAPSAAPAPTPTAPANTAKAASTPAITATASHATATPAITATPVPSAAVTPALTLHGTQSPQNDADAATTLSAEVVESNEDTGAVVLAIDTRSLPKGARSIALPDGRILPMTDGEDTLRIEMNRDDLSGGNPIRIVALSEDETPLGTIALQAVQQNTAQAEKTNRIGQVILWIVLGLIVAAAMVSLYLFLMKRKRA